MELEISGPTRIECMVGGLASPLKNGKSKVRMAVENLANLLERENADQIVHEILIVREVMSVEPGIREWISYTVLERTP